MSFCSSLEMHVEAVGAANFGRVAPNAVESVVGVCRDLSMNVPTLDTL